MAILPWVHGSVLAAIVSQSVVAHAARPPTPAATPETRQQAGTSFTWLGPAREIARGWSASQDTPAMTMGIAPRPVLNGGGEFALATLQGPRLALRGGFTGFVELTFDGSTNTFHFGPAPGSSNSRILWRGAYSYYLSVAPRTLAHRICSACRLEATLQYRHESQHYTGDSEGGQGINVDNQPYVGDEMLLDIALSQRHGRWYFAERTQCMWFLPERSSYFAGTAFDLHARYMPWLYAHPFASVYGEYIGGDDLHGRRYPDAHRLRGLLGFALPSNLGDILVFASGDIGHRYGVRILTEEATIGLGVRLVVGTTDSAFEVPSQR
jgi:hypothetical protein